MKSDPLFERKKTFWLLSQALDSEKFNIQTFLSFSHCFLSTQTIVYNLGNPLNELSIEIETGLSTFNSEVNRNAAFGERMIDCERWRLLLLPVNPKVWTTWVRSGESGLNLGQPKTCKREFSQVIVGRPKTCKQKFSQEILAQAPFNDLKGTVIGPTELKTVT